MLKYFTIYLVIAGSSFGLMIIIAVMAKVFSGHGETIKAPAGRVAFVMKIIYLLLFLLLGFSLVPVAVKFLGDAFSALMPQSPFGPFLRDDGDYIVYGFWIVFITGLAIALPAMSRGGFFKD